MTDDSISKRLAALARTSRVESESERITFEIDDRVVGSVLPSDAELLARRVPGVALDTDCLSITPVCAPDAPATLDAIALALRDAGRSNRWRNEALPVCADDGTVLGRIERGCVRVLGVRTFAVHLVGTVERDGQTWFWIQRRSPDKDVDPGCLDTLAGGLVGMAADGRSIEPFGPALVREIREEAGLEPEQYSAPVNAGSWRVHGPVEGGYMVEDLMVWHARLADQVTPQNQDGEVSEFLCVDRAELIRLIDRGELTREAVIVSLMALQNLAAPAA